MSYHSTSLPVPQMPPVCQRLCCVPPRGEGAVCVVPGLQSRRALGAREELAKEQFPLPSRLRSPVWVHLTLRSTLALAHHGLGLTLQAGVSWDWGPQGSGHGSKMATIGRQVGKTGDQSTEPVWEEDMYVPYGALLKVWAPALLSAHLSNDRNLKLSENNHLWIYIYIYICWDGLLFFIS